MRVMYSANDNTVLTCVMWVSLRTYGCDVCDFIRYKSMVLEGRSYDHRFQQPLLNAVNIPSLEDESVCASQMQSCKVLVERVGFGVSCSVLLLSSHIDR